MPEVTQLSYTIPINTVFSINEIRMSLEALVESVVIEGDEIKIDVEDINKARLIRELLRILLSLKRCDTENFDKLGDLKDEFVTFLDTFLSGRRTRMRSIYMALASRYGLNVEVDAKSFIKDLASQEDAREVNVYTALRNGLTYNYPRDECPFVIKGSISGKIRLIHVSDH